MINFSIKDFYKSTDRSFISVNDLIYLVLIFIFSIFMYLLLLRYYVPLTTQIIPWGDPFTYEINYYSYLDFIAENNFFNSLLHAGARGWYWLQRTLVFIFSPILIKEPYSICFVNYFFYGLVSCTIYLLCRELRLDSKKSFFLSLLVWTYPINYHFFEYSSLPVMGLDSTFIASIYTLLFSSFLFVLNPKKLFYQILFAICIAMTIVGRGNSITVFSLCLFAPFIFFATYTFIEKNYSNIKFVFIPLFSFIITLSVYYYFCLPYILSYYSVFKGFLTSDFGLSYVYLKNIPGIFFYYPHPSKLSLLNETSYIILSITLLTHIICLYSFYLFLKTKKKESKLLLFSGLFVFYGTLIVNLLLWLHPHINIYNAQLIWAPMRVGFLIIIISIFYEFFNTYNLKFYGIINILLVIFIFNLASNLYEKNLIDQLESKIDSTPNNIREITKLMLEESTEGKPIILWYGPYLNPKIPSYYLLKDGKEEINYFRDKYADLIWHQTATGEDFQNKIVFELDKIFKQAGLIIINENSTNYVGGYGYYRYSNLLTDRLRKIDSNKFTVIAKIKSSRGNLLMLKRLKTEKKSNFFISFEGDDYLIEVKDKVRKL